jgi:hypothetical protein
MARLNARLPDFGDTYDMRKHRAMVQTLEQQLSRVVVDSTVGAYSVTADHTVGTADGVILVDTTGGDIEVFLPEISDDLVAEKYEVEIVKTAAANTLTITPLGATDTIVGEPDAIVTIQWTALRFRATTGNWVLI